MIIELDRSFPKVSVGWLPKMPRLIRQVTEGRVTSTNYVQLCSIRGRYGVNARARTMGHRRHLADEHPTGQVSVFHIRPRLPLRPIAPTEPFWETYVHMGGSWILDTTRDVYVAFLKGR